MWTSIWPLKNTGYKYFQWEIDNDTDDTIKAKYNLITNEYEKYNDETSLIEKLKEKIALQQQKVKHKIF